MIDGVCAQVGKWDVGMASHEQTPHGRGYDTSLGFFNHAPDKWSQVTTQISCPDPTKPHAQVPMVDLFMSGDTEGRRTRPAKHLNGTGYTDDIFLRRAVDIIDKHDPSTPLFLHFAPEAVVWHL